MRSLALLLFAFALPAQAGYLERRLVEPPPVDAREQQALGELLRSSGAEPDTQRLASGLLLGYAVLEPNDYGASLDFRNEGAQFSVRFRSRQPDGPPEAAAGTVVVLHGWGMDSRLLLPWAMDVAQHGQRALLVDLRNHGRSGRAPAGYGTHEGEDVAELLRALRAQGLIEGPLHLVGISYGAVSAAHAARTLGREVDSLLLLAPFANAAEGAASAVRGLLDMPASGLRRMWWAWARRYYTDARIARAVERAGSRLELDLAGLELAPVLQAVPACRLLVHGAVDRLIPVQQARRLAAEVPDLAYWELPDDGHFSLPARVGWLGPPLHAWMQGAAASCRLPVLPEDPAPGPD
jgi:pimeloyl-ACP methyl ester carboxylesterase